MRIGIMSDTHGSLADFERALRVCGLCELWLHVGDVLYHGPRNPLPPGYQPADLAKRLQKMTNILFVRGNCDAEVDEMVTGHDLHQEERLLELGGRRILLTHGHGERDDARVKRALAEGIDLVISGHTHRRQLEVQNGIVLLNPGSTTLPKDERKSCAVIDQDTVQILDIESGEVLASHTFPGSPPARD